jgi:uncharacterized membrane protein
MAKTVIGLMDNPSQAQRVVEELLQSGFDRGDIGIVVKDIREEGEAVFEGSFKGMAIGALAGMLLAATASMVPGLGLVLVAGPMVGGAIGALAGGLASALMRQGVPEADAHFYAEGVRRGGALVTVNAQNDELAARALEIMKRHGAVDVEQRAAEWKRQGWSGRGDGESDAAQANRSAYGGPERRVGTEQYAGTDRRVAA